MPFGDARVVGGRPGEEAPAAALHRRDQPGDPPRPPRPEDAQRADELFSILMGEDVEARRSFITRNAKDVRFLDV